MTSPAPLFILGSPRSFTSLLCAMLGQHPQAYGVPELNLFTTTTLGALAEKMRGIRHFQIHGLLRTIAQLYAGEQTIESVEMAQRWILRRYDEPVGQIYQEICHQVAPLKIIDKSPVYGTRPEILKRIKTTFPDAHYLYLVRHPKNQCNSMMNVAGGMMTVLAGSVDYSTPQLTVDPQYLWVKMQWNIQSFLKDIPEHRTLRLRGEDVLNDTYHYFRLICDWLGFEWDDTIYQSMLSPHESPYACLGPYGAHLGNDINFLKSPVFKSQQVKMGDLAGPLPWRSDGKGFNQDVLAMAQQLGYS